jgi:hypothetical protein
MRLTLKVELADGSPCDGDFPLAASEALRKELERSFGGNVKFNVEAKLDCGPTNGDVEGPSQWDPASVSTPLSEKLKYVDEKVAEARGDENSNPVADPVGPATPAPRSKAKPQ